MTPRPRLKLNQGEKDMIKSLPYDKKQYLTITKYKRRVIVLNIVSFTEALGQEKCCLLLLCLDITVFLHSLAQTLSPSLLTPDCAKAAVESLVPIQHLPPLRSFEAQFTGGDGKTPGR